MFGKRILYLLSKIKKHTKRPITAYTVISKSVEKKYLGDAVVIGGGIAGLLAARILLNHFETITIIERDLLTAHPAGRPSTPHAKHARLFHVTGCKIIEALFPGVCDEIVARGGHLLSATQDVCWLAPLTPNDKQLDAQDELLFLSCTHDLLEWSIRKRLQDHPRIHIADNVEATGLILDKKARKVVGVKTRMGRLGERGSYSTLDIQAELVVDASGNHSKAPQWLTALGFAAPIETIVDAQMTFASRIYEMPERGQADWKALILEHAMSQHGVGSLLLPVEGNCWQVTLSGAGAFAPTGNEMEFVGSLRSLGDASLYDVLITAKPVTPIFVHQVSASYLRHYERVEHYPAGFIVLGDAICSATSLVEPGISLAASACVLLDQMLSQSTTRDLSRTFAHRFQQKLASQVEQAWCLATRQVYFHDAAARAKLSYKTRLKFYTLDRAIAVCGWDQAARTLFLNVHHGVEPVSSLYQPWVFAKIFQDALRFPRKQRMSTLQPYAIERSI